MSAEPNRDKMRNDNNDDSDLNSGRSGDDVERPTGESASVTNANRTNKSISNTPSKRGKSKRKWSKKNKNKKSQIAWSVTNDEGKPVSNSKYSYSSNVQEDHRLPIYGCGFYESFREDQPPVFATVGSNRVTIYECSNGGSIRRLQCYADPDPEENFYTCAWSEDETGKPLLAAAGARGVTRLFAPTSESCIKHYLGHGDAIIQLIFHPEDGNLLLSASKDHSLRLWNVQTDICVVIFGGLGGHRDEVLAADIDSTGSRMVSCGMDHAMKVWKLKKPEIEGAIKLSYAFKPNSCIPFPTMQQNFPDFSTRDIHRNYVDCAKWFGEFIFSKSCDEQIMCWKAGTTFQKWDEVLYTSTDTSVITKFDVKDCELWYIRFALDFKKETLALGNQIGKTYVYDLNVEEPNQIKVSILFHPKCTSAIRQTAFSRDGSVLICVCEDATIWRWNINNEQDEDKQDGDEQDKVDE